MVITIGNSKVCNKITSAPLLQIQSMNKAFVAVSEKSVGIECVSFYKF
jgi:hypothetical protein